MSTGEMLELKEVNDSHFIQIEHFPERHIYNFIQDWTYIILSTMTSKSW